MPGERNAGWLSEVERAVGGQRYPGRYRDAGSEEGNRGSDSNDGLLWSLKVITVFETKNG